jgi:hypothetical protein
MTSGGVDKAYIAALHESGPGTNSPFSRCGRFVGYPVFFCRALAATGPVEPDPRRSSAKCR